MTEDFRRILGLTDSEKAQKAYEAQSQHLWVSYEHVGGVTSACLLKVMYFPWKESYSQDTYKGE
jgi:hypothetical protein